MRKTIEELLAECSEVYTRERFDADRARLVARLCAKHGIAASEIDSLIREHRYEHTAEDPEDEWIQIMAFARAAGWS
ncbi:MAG TPA: hypothetical protein VLE97_09700 [Gaiellaceae bacterium]|nr:hypothetical protein [Gaiellaceae bacterium]